MRVIESESKQGAYIIVIFGLIAAYFGFYILTGILLLMLLAWLFFCSSKLINPTIPNAIVSPISGVIENITHNGDCVEFSIKVRRNGRIYSPSDLHDISVKKYHGFYFLRKSELSNQLGVKELMQAKTMLDNESLSIKIEVLPRVLRFCGLYDGKLESLFLEKIGFLNVGLLRISIKGENLKVLAKEHERVLGGSSPLITIEK
ncbi:hypothetical protein LS77_001365 [Helicobacter bilis]|uniref:Phosphatidylserine decarboxylase n=2 Tax=Helicobacter bilis TaxID=37372 RepID=A0A6D2CEY1_9HELI|nr:hypothetical protein [Helicobacter bilis]EMZ39922.1 hypothetical protein C826_00744 [Helicobacter bilis WiWa]TLE06110.1 hypothetical protein LS77_001365 [Helicobacter bilis]TLE06919.1 hypothetical protein LS76_001105 [Helicobacter bilis]